MDGWNHLMRVAGLLCSSGSTYRVFYALQLNGTQRVYLLPKLVDSRRTIVLSGTTQSEHGQIGIGLSHLGRPFH